MGETSPSLRLLIGMALIIVLNIGIFLFKGTVLGETLFSRATASTHEFVMKSINNFYVFNTSWNLKAAHLGGISQLTLTSQDNLVSFLLLTSFLLFYSFLLSFLLTGPMTLKSSSSWFQAKKKRPISIALPGAWAFHIELQDALCPSGAFKTSKFFRLKSWTISLIC